MTYGNAVLDRVLLPLRHHYAANDIEEIVVCDPCLVFHKMRMPDENGRIWHPVTDPAITLDYLDLVAHTFAAVYDMKFDRHQHPALYGMIPGTTCHYRITLALGRQIFYRRPPPAQGGCVVAIRPLMNEHQPLPLDSWDIRPGIRLPSSAVPLLRRATMTSDDTYREILEALRAGHPFLISGPPGAGKSNLLRRFLSEIRDQHRIVTIEDTAELPVRQPNRTRILIPRDIEEAANAGINPRSVIDLITRISPSVVVVGEISTSNAAMAREAMNTGTTHCLTTIHADDPVEASHVFADRLRHAQPNIDVDQVAADVRRRMAIVQLGPPTASRRMTAWAPPGTLA